MLTPPDKLTDRIAQLIFPRIGSNMNPTVSVSDDADRIEKLMDDYAIGGLCLFNGDRIRTPHTLTQLQSRSRFPLLIGTDMERGLGQQLTGATLFPHAMAFQATGSNAESFVEEAARVSAREALAAGIHISFSPVADINSNPRNPIISTRAFGTTPETVSDLVSAHIKGCNGEGLLCTAKHFPGHGDTETDSHKTLPVVAGTKTDLEKRELIPFARAIDQGVSLVMTAHVAYPGLDPSGVSATRSSRILNDLLRKQMGFRGAVISDSLLMAGANPGSANQDDGNSEENNFGRENPGVMAATMLRAGVDILLDIDDVPTTIEYLASAVTSGNLPRIVIDRAFERVWALKARMAVRFGKGVFVDPSLSQPLSIIGAEEHRKLAMRIASKSIQLAIGDRENLIFKTEKMGQKGPICILVRPQPMYNDTGDAPLKRAFLAAYPTGGFVEIGPDADSPDLESLVDDVQNHSSVVVAVVVKPAAWHEFGLPPVLQQFVKDLVDRYPVFLAALGSPMVFADFAEVHAGICAYSDVEPSMIALVDYLKSLESKAEMAPQPSIP